MRRACAVVLPSGKPCPKPGTVTPLPQFWFCDSHDAALARHYGATPQVIRTKSAAAYVVYYIANPELRSDRGVVKAVKIGTSSSFRDRFAAVKTEAPGSLLLAVEPGHFELERARHHQFRDLRLRTPHGRASEWFMKSDELMAHINALRSEWGDPWNWDAIRGAALLNRR